NLSFGGGCAHISHLTDEGTMNFFVGTSGYSYPEWKGSFYPAKLPAKEMLGFYAARFRTVEINNTFYCPPTASVLEAWAARVPAGAGVPPPVVVRRRGVRAAPRLPGGDVRRRRGGRPGGSARGDSRLGLPAAAPARVRRCGATGVGGADAVAALAGVLRVLQA